MRAWIDNQKGVGYVVCWLENRTNTPLRNFGLIKEGKTEKEIKAIVRQKPNDNEQR